VADAVRRRVRHELGLEITDLRSVLPDFAYTAADASGVVENEICPVFAADSVEPAPSLLPNPDEVMDFAWVDWPDAVRAMASAPFAFSPWSVQQVALLEAHRRS
jgi:isopentenyl-diphosphate delta-isomerase